ncbi:conserved hypothetical protein [Anaeromyxobacter sp. K]|uniref:hypothetical protein n=1 Tax=Anaeromyxobacter sp. (strain K) TaxID=447217 RepID=UPI00015F88F4|nr:hypothetical protein [Anaeromyxobacter sp. K]ACG75178.1 conserved hypothetical protein [Anaeromyxobacter sp. K]
MRNVLFVAALGAAMVACGGGSSGGGSPADACPAGVHTTVSGIVHAPNGTLPVSGAWVYVPAGAPPAIPDGTQCRRCGSSPPGAVAWTRTDAVGRFQLSDVPPGSNVAVVAEIGGWRRQATVAVTACADTAVPADAIRLPRTSAEGRLPQIAVSTGASDALECVLRKLGVADSEFGTAGGAARVHLYAGSGGASVFDAALGGGAFAPSTDLWASRGALDEYELVMLSCEGAQNPDTKPAAALRAMFDHVNAGGRLLASHWHNYWIASGPAPWPASATFASALPDLGTIDAAVDLTTARGGAIADWLLAAGTSSTRGTVTLSSAKHTATAVAAGVEPWLVYAGSSPASVQWFSFDAPLGAAAAQRCGRVTFTDLHANGGDQSAPALAFPSGGCTSTSLSPNEKVLLLEILEAGRCIE